MRGAFAAIALLLASVVPTAAGAEEPAADLVRQARRIVVLGDSITYAGGWLANVIAWMESKGLTAEVIDVGLSSETVSGLSEEGHAGGKFPRPDLAERLERVLRVARPDLVIACYGMNCGIYQPLDESRFAKFREGIQRLRDAVTKSGAKIIHLTPPVYDKRPDAAGPAGSADYDAVLDAYSRWLVGKRSDGWTVIDVHGPMRRAIDEARKKDPKAVFAGDTVHPNDAGHWLIARAVIAGLGDEEAARAETPAAFAAFLPAVKQRMHLLRDAYLAAAGHQRPGVPGGLPIGEAEAKAREVTESIRSRRLHLMGGQQGTPEWKNPIDWPTPRVVDPGPAPSAPAPPPADAIVLFDGSNLDAWENGGNWPIAAGVATVGKGHVSTKRGFGDCQLHVEFRTPKPATGKGQGRGNSGVFLMDKYEIQILDSFPDGTDGPVTYVDGQCGALYKQQPPAVNACRAPGEWQTYDILFSRPRFRPDGSLERPARISVLHNGVAIHSDAIIKGDTFFDAPPGYAPHAEALPVRLQDHGDPVQFRSIWIRPFEPIRPKESARPR